MKEAYNIRLDKDARKKRPCTCQPGVLHQITMRNINKKFEYWNELLIVAGAILLTLWQIDFIDWFPEYKVVISRILYFLILVFLIYFLVDGFKNKDRNKKCYILLPAAIIFLVLLVYSFLPEDLKSTISFMKIVE